MKTKITIALFALLFCACEDDPVQTDIGCTTARSKQTDQVVFLRCETVKQFNPTDIRSSQWDTTDSTYYNYVWEACESCR